MVIFIYEIFSYINGQLRIGNPSRKQLFGGLISGPFIYEIFSYVNGQTRIGNPSRKQLFAGLIMALLFLRYFHSEMGKLKLEIHHVSTFSIYI